MENSANRKDWNIDIEDERKFWLSKMYSQQSQRNVKNAKEVTYV